MRGKEHFPYQLMYRMSSKFRSILSVALSRPPRGGSTSTVRKSYSLTSTLLLLSASVYRRVRRISRENRSLGT